MRKLTVPGDFAVSLYQPDHITPCQPCTQYISECAGRAHDTSVLKRRSRELHGHVMFKNRDVGAVHYFGEILRAVAAESSATEEQRLRALTHLFEMRHETTGLPYSPTDEFIFRTQPHMRSSHLHYFVMIIAQSPKSGIPTTR